MNKNENPNYRPNYLPDTRVGARYGSGRECNECQTIGAHMHWCAKSE